MSFEYFSPFLYHAHPHTHLTCTPTHPSHTSHTHPHTPHTPHTHTLTPLTHTLLTHTPHSALHDNRNKLLADVFYASMLDNMHQEGLQLEALELHGYMGEGEHENMQASLLFHVLLPSADNPCTIRTLCLSIRMTTGQVSTQAVWSPCEYTLPHCSPCTESLCAVFDTEHVPPSLPQW